MKISIANLKRLIREATSSDNKIETGTSLDAQVDRYLASYEETATQVKKESIWRGSTKRLFEADEDETDNIKTQQKDSDSIDVEKFTNDVVRLIENYDSLLEVQSTLVRRAHNFLIENGYTDDVVKLFETSLREQHGIVAGMVKGEVEAEDFVAPAADRAGPEVGGAGG